MPVKHGQNGGVLGDSGCATYMEALEALFAVENICSVPSNEVDPPIGNYSVSKGNTKPTTLLLFGSYSMRGITLIASSKIDTILGALHDSK